MDARNFLAVVAANKIAGRIDRTARLTIAVEQLTVPFDRHIICEMGYNQSAAIKIGVLAFAIICESMWANKITFKIVQLHRGFARRLNAKKPEYLSFALILFAFEVRHLCMPNSFYFIWFWRNFFVAFVRKICFANFGCCRIYSAHTTHSAQTHRNSLELFHEPNERRTQKNTHKK